jgi:hypothetical protein
MSFEPTSAMQFAAALISVFSALFAIFLPR